MNPKILFLIILALAPSFASAEKPLDYNDSKSIVIEQISALANHEITVLEDSPDKYQVSCLSGSS